ncbi:hypothetical protein N7488_005161 [Penicillium malachiteum]|nr:hypothetical protein N7488_005161 [Penicillium malachiteum]
MRCGCIRWMQGKFKRTEEKSFNPSDPTGTSTGPIFSTRNDPEKPPVQTLEKTGFQPKNLLQIAYSGLDSKDQESLSSLQETITGDHACRVDTAELVDEVIRLTEKRYENYKKGGSIKKSTQKHGVDLGKLAHRVLSAALSFKDVIGAVAALDVTNHASSVWAAISLGLKMTQNHIEIRMAIFESSAFLADALAHCAFVDKHHYQNKSLEDKDMIEGALKQIYKGILRYVAQLRRDLQAHAGRKLLQSINTVDKHPLKEIEWTITEDKEKLYRWVQNSVYLRHEQDAATYLARIDKSIGLIKGIHHRMDLNRLEDVKGASFDSYRSQHDELCLPGTRVELLNDILTWGSSSQGAVIFLLSGMAGTGKSTISRTVARAFQEKGQLGASFFFKRGEGDRGNATKFFSTIVRQLVIAIPELIHGVSAAIESDPDIIIRSFPDQFEKLILQPLRTVKGSLSHIRDNMILVIDALDECDGDKDVSLLLKLLSRLDEPGVLRLRVFMTSRPELPIEHVLKTEEVLDHHQKFILHDIPKCVIKQDIARFLDHRLHQIDQDRFPNFRLDQEENSHQPQKSRWMRQIEIHLNTLVNMSVPLFIFAATLCRTFEQLDLEPMTILTEILEYRNVESQLDATYLPILRRLFRDCTEERRMSMVDEFHHIVGTILVLESPLSISSLSRLLRREPSLIRIRLNPLRTVLRIPEDEDDESPITLFHLSFRDFMLGVNNWKKTDLWVDAKRSHRRLTQKCLDNMKDGLRKDICGLTDDGFNRIDIDENVKNEKIKPELQYCCRYWTQHVFHSEGRVELVDEISGFLHANFLHWAEVMCILGYASEMRGAIERLQSIFQVEHESELSRFLCDARRFILKNQHIADIAPLQLYCSGLIFAPEKSIIRAIFHKEIPPWISKLPRVEGYWNAELQTLEGHGSGVNSVVFSPDGRCLVSGSADKTVRLWDITTGAELQSLEGHQDTVLPESLRSGRWPSGFPEGVLSVACSQNGQWIASGSDDSTVKLWDASTGVELQTLEGHGGLVNSVAFSPNGRYLASGCDDHTIKLWDIAAGTKLQSLEGHRDSVLSVAFSQNGQWLASGSQDMTVKLWNSNTGVELQTFQGHTDQVYSVAFSQDNGWLASSSNDLAIILWNPATGARLHTLKEHCEGVLSVAFSPDGRYLASSSLDRTVKLWDPTNGTLLNSFECFSWLPSVAFSSDGQWLVCGSCDHSIHCWDPRTGRETQTLEKHTYGVLSVGLSPDRKLLASGSWEQPIKLWDATTSAYIDTLWGHKSSVQSLVFSPDGQRLASASHDLTIKLWDPVSRENLQTLVGHEDWVMSLAFSPDGRWLASGSKDMTIRLWDLATGTLHRTLTTQDTVTEIKFATDGFFLETNLGPFPVEIEKYHSASPIPAAEVCHVSILGEDWIALHGKKALWLPSNQRPFRTSIIIRGSWLVIGNTSGRISISQF